MNGTVLIVDDNRHFRGTLKLFLRLAGVQSFDEACNAGEAIHKAAEHPPQVIILDLAMPGMSGVEAAPHLKRAAPGTHILLFTFHDPALHEHDDAIDSVVSKLEPSKLADRVRAILTTENSSEYQNEDHAYRRG